MGDTTALNYCQNIYSVAYIPKLNDETLEILQKSVSPSLISVNEKDTNIYDINMCIETLKSLKMHQAADILENLDVQFVEF